VADNLLTWRSLNGDAEALRAYQALVGGNIAASEALLVEVDAR